MIIFIENGGLGNQLIQYHGLKRNYPKDKIIILGCDELQRNFDIVDAFFISKKIINHWISFSIVKKIIFFLASIRIFSKVTEKTCSTGLIITVIRGIFTNIKVPYGVYFQYSDLFDQYESMPKIKIELIASANLWLSKKINGTENRFLVFVHIRRGDYLYWPSKEYPAALSISWYKRAMKIIQDKYVNTVFVMMSDDQLYLQDIFEESDSLIISKNTAEIDLAIMSNCHSGILSAGSFALCGAFLSHYSHKTDSTFIAPKYWCGHRAKKWFPTIFSTKHLTYLI